MADQAYRIEQDSMGEVRVPADALYGAQIQRAVEISRLAVCDSRALFFERWA